MKDDEDHASYIDITTQFRKSIESLRIGGMVHSSGFRIEDAMSSIELMEPKMDPGFGNREKILRREKMTKEIVSRVFTSDEACRIADILIGQLKLWMEGHIYIQNHTYA